MQEAHTQSGDVTLLLRQWRSGDPHAHQNLFPLIHDELVRIAHYRRNRGTGETMVTQALVNEAYVRMMQSPPADWQNRIHFLAFASRVIRHIVVDAARTRAAAKRGAGLTRVELHPDVCAVPEPPQDLVRVDEALEQLRQMDKRKADVVELRFFGGLNNDEIASVLDISVATVKRDWTLAKAWIYRALRDQPASAIAS
jgi:RNA polymerase sigma factor (TIGR02999 family)